MFGYNLIDLFDLIMNGVFLVILIVGLISLLYIFMVEAINVVKPKRIKNLSTIEDRDARFFREIEEFRSDFY